MRGPKVAGVISRTVHIEAYVRDQQDVDDASGSQLDHTRAPNTCAS